MKINTAREFASLTVISVSQTFILALYVILVLVIVPYGYIKAMTIIGLPFISLFILLKFWYKSIFLGIKEHIENLE